jgi:hypothetical protein
MPFDSGALQSFALLVGGAIIGFLIGVVWYSGRGARQRRVQQELWDRKFRLAEADREAITARAWSG